MPEEERRRWVPLDKFTAYCARIDAFVAATEKRLEDTHQLLMQRAADELRVRQIFDQLARQDVKHQEHFAWRDGVREALQLMEARLGERMARIELRQNRVLWTFLGGLAALQLAGALLGALARTLPEGVLRVILEQLG